MLVIWLIGIALAAGSLYLPNETEEQDARAFGTAVLGIAIVIVAAIMEFARQ